MKKPHMQLLRLHTVVKDEMAELQPIHGRTPSLEVFLVRFKELGRLFNIQGTNATEVNRGEAGHMFLFNISLYGLSAN